MLEELLRKIKDRPTLEVVMLRNLLHHEIERRLDCAMIGVPHTEREIEAHDEKTKAAQDALREAQEPKEST